MNKHIFILNIIIASLLLLVSCYFLKLYYFKKNIHDQTFFLNNNNKNIYETYITHPENVTIAFDIHQVLVQKKTYNYFTALWKVSGKIQCIYELISALFTTNTLLKTYKLYKQQVKVSEAYLRIFKDLGYDHLYKECIQYTTNLYPQITPGIIEILQQLNLKKYNLILFSNSGPDILLNLIKTYPQVFNFFKNINGIIKNSINETFSYETLIWKPQPIAYENMIQQANSFNHQIAIFFIDDTLKNITIANKYNIQSIHYITNILLLKSLIDLKLL